MMPRLLPVLIVVILAINIGTQAVVAQNYTLSFDIKGYWYSTTGRVEIYLDDAILKTLRSKDFPNSGGRAPPTDPAHITLNLGDATGKQVKIRYVSMAGGGWVLIDNITITKDGKQVRFAPWTVNKNPSNTGIDAKKIFGREKRLVFIELDNVNSGDYAEFISQPLQDSPELEIRPSYIKFTPETPYSAPTMVNISAKVRNIGSLDANNVKLELRIDNEKVYETPVFSVPSGGEVTKNLHLFDYRDGVVKVEVRVVSGDDVLGENNAAVRFLVPAHPYMLFNNVTETPIWKYGDRDPYKSWKNHVIGRAERYLGENLTATTYKGRKILALAFAYSLTNDERFASKAVEGLLTAGDETEGSTIYGGTEHIYLRAEKNALYYAFAFDFLREYIYSKNKTQYRLIEDRLVKIAKELKWKAYLYHNYNFKESLPRDGNLADPNNNMLREDPILVVVMGSLLGYSGNELDYINPYQTIRDAMKNMFFESITGAPYPAALIVHLPGGYTYQGMYRGQYIGTLAIGVMTYHRMFGDDLINDLARGILDQPVWHSDPTGGEPNTKGTRAGGVAWREQWITAELYQGQDRLNHQWYINHVLMKDGLQAAGLLDDIAKTVFPGIFYNYTWPESEPKWNGSYSYFSKANAKAIFRDGRDGMENWLKLYGHNHPIWSSATTSRTYHGAYSIWAKGAYLVVDRGDERGWRGTGVKQEGGFGFSSFIFNENLVPARWEQFGKLDNPSLLTDYLVSENVESANIFTELRELRNVDTGSESVFPAIKWNRTVIFPKDYFIILDRIDSDGSYTFDMTIQYGGTEADTTKTPDVNYPVKGILKIDGKVVDWWNREPISVVTNSVSWATESLRGVTSKPLYQTTHWVELDTFIAPRCQVTYDLSGLEYGSKGDLDHLWHPFIKARQSGQHVKYITIHYPRNLNLSDEAPIFSELQISGGDRNDYAVSVTTDRYYDTVHISDGELLRYDAVTTDAVMAFTRYNRSGDFLEYFHLKDFTTYSFNGSDLISSDSRIANVIVEYTKDRIKVVLGPDPGKVHRVKLWVGGAGNITVLRNGMRFDEWGVVDDSHIWISVYADAPTTYEIAYNGSSAAPKSKIQDVVPPATEYETKPNVTGTEWSTTPVVVTFFRSDNVGVAYTNYSLVSEKGPWTKVEGEQPFSITISDEGETTVWYYSVDVNGNAEQIRSFTVRIDMTPPRVENVSVSASNTSATIIWSTDEVSTCTILYGTESGSLNRTATCTGYSTNHTLVIDQLIPGTRYYFRIYAEDLAGNSNTTSPFTFTTLQEKDLTPPVLVLTSPSVTEIHAGWVNVSIISSEPLRQAVLQWDGRNYTMNGYGTEWYYNITNLTDGTFSFRVYGEDDAGNWNSTETYNVTVVTPPSAPEPVPTPAPTPTPTPAPAPESGGSAGGSYGGGGFGAFPPPLLPNPVQFNKPDQESGDENETEEGVTESVNESFEVAVPENVTAGSNLSIKISHPETNGTLTVVFPEEWKMPNMTLNMTNLSDIQISVPDVAQGNYSLKIIYTVNNRTLTETVTVRVVKADSEPETTYSHSTSSPKSSPIKVATTPAPTPLTPEPEVTETILPTPSPAVQNEDIEKMGMISRVLDIIESAVKGIIDFFTNLFFR